MTTNACCFVFFAISLSLEEEHSIWVAINERRERQVMKTNLNIVIDERRDNQYLLN
jgi:hypothetical protein